MIKRAPFLCAEIRGFVVFDNQMAHIRPMIVKIGGIKLIRNDWLVWRLDTIIISHIKKIDGFFVSSDQISISGIRRNV